MYQKIAMNTKMVFKKPIQKIIFVSAADSSHFLSLCQLINSLQLHEKSSTIIVYDLGFKPNQIDILNKDFKNVILRKFQFENYPDYFNIKKNAGEYAWKPVIIHSVFNEFKSNVCWMDAGNVVHKPLKKVRRVIETLGFYSPQSNGNIEDWTHPKTLELLLESNDQSFLKKKNLNGACIALNYQNTKTRKLVQLWSKYAQIKKYIAPEGSSRDNHRQDQAVLTVLAYQIIPEAVNVLTKKKLGFKIHQDCD